MVHAPDAPAELSGEQLAATPAPRSIGFGVLIVALLACSQYATVLPVLGPRLQDYFALSNRQLGTMFSFGAAGGFVALPLVVPLMRRIGLRNLVCLGFLGTGLAFILCGVSRSLLLLEAGLFAVGLFLAILSIAGMAFMIELFPATKRRALSIGLTASAFPAIVFPPGLQYLLSVLGDSPAATLLMLQAPFLLFGVVLIAGAGVVRGLAGAHGNQSAEPVPPLNWRKLLSPSCLVIVFLAALHGACDNGSCTWLPKFMTANFTHMPIAPGMVLSLYGVAYLVGRLMLAAAPEGLWRRGLVVIPGPLSGLILLIAVWKGSALQVGLLYPLAAFIWGLQYPSLISEIDSDSSSQFSGVLVGASLAMSAMSVMMLNAAGFLADTTGSIHWAMTLMAIGFVLFGVVSLVAGVGRSPAQNTIDPSERELA